MPMKNISYDFQYAYGKPPISAVFKQAPADFKVTENLGFELSGSGEHVCVLIEKVGLNTNDVVKILSRYCRVSQRDISYSGLKDRQAVTRQWFSLRMGIKQDLDLSNFKHPSVTIVEMTRNSRKIKRGSHTGNTFSIRLKKLSAPAIELEERVALIQAQGVPNYFGPQRFGKNQDNVDRALSLFKDEIKVKDRFLRGIYFSAARSWLFNHNLSTRISQDNWNSYLSGDVMALAGSSSSFSPEAWDDVLEERLNSFDIHPSGPMWGAGALLTSDLSLLLDKGLLEDYPELCDGLVVAGLKQERRSLRLCPLNLQIYPEATDVLVIEFGLEKGAYATSVLRELVNIE